MATFPSPSSATPKMGGVTVPSGPTSDPPCRPWSLSTAPMAARVAQDRPHSGFWAAFARATPA